MTDVSAETGLVNPAEEAGIKIGDVIISMNGKKVNSSEDVAKIIEESNGEKVKAEIRRKNMSFEVEIAPVKEASDGVYKMGLWVRAVSYTHLSYDKSMVWIPYCSSSESFGWETYRRVAYRCV